jgi:hypothetical protein
MALVRKRVTFPNNASSYQVEDTRQAFSSSEKFSDSFPSSTCSYGLRPGTSSNATHVREMTNALLRRELAFRTFAEQGLSTDEGRINAFAWAAEGSFKDRSAGIMSMFNVLNALMLVIVLQVLINPPLFQGRSWSPSDPNRLTADTRVQLWTLFCVLASCGLIYTVYMTAFLYVSYVCCGSDLECLIFHARMRMYYFSTTAFTFISYLSLIVSLFISSNIFYGGTSYMWFIFVILLSLLTIIVLIYSRVSAALTYKMLVSLENCYERTMTGETSRVLKPFWADQLHLLEFGTPAPRAENGEGRSQEQSWRDTVMPVVNPVFDGRSE